MFDHKERRYLKYDSYLKANFFLSLSLRLPQILTPFIKAVTSKLNGSENYAPYI